MNGPGASKVTYGEAFLLLNFSEVEMDINMFDNLFLSRLYGKKLTKAEVDGVFEEGDPQGEVEFDRLHNSVLAYQRMRYFALTLAEMRGLMTRSASSTLRQASGGNATGYSTTGLALTSSDRLSSSRYSNTHSILRSQSQPAVLTESQATLLRSLPPIRLRKMQEASVKKKTMKKAGYDSSFSRPTPRVLQASGAGSIGGRKKADIEGLRRELYIAKEGMKQLDKLVDNNIAWVQSNCDVQTAAPHFSLRTIKKCRTMAIERIHNVFNNYVQVTLAWGWQRWLTACQYSLFMDRSHDFSKLKSIELITVTMYDALSRQYAKGFNQWIHLVHKEKMLEAEAASVEIQRIVRGYNGKNRFKRVKYDLAATLIQCLLRKKKAYKVMDEKKKELAGRNIHQAARIIQQFIKDRICIIRAKKEAERRRQLQAAISIQKIHRGAAARSKKDLEQITSDKHDSSKTIDSGISVTPSGKRSLFKPSTWRQSTPTSSSRPSSQQGNKKLPKNVLDEGNEADAETAEVKPSEAVSHRSEESTVSRIQKVSRGKTARTQSRKKNAIFGSMFSGRDCSVDSNSDCNRVRDDISDSSDGEKSVNSGTSSRIEKYFRVLYKAFKPAEVDKKALDIQRVVRGALARKLSQKLKKEKSLKMSNSSRDDEIPSSPMEVDEIISSRISTSKELPDIPKQILKEGSSDEEKRPKSSNFGIDTPGVASVTRPYASPDIFHNPSKSASSEGFDRGEDSYRSAQSIGNENVQAVEDSCIIPTTVKEDLTENQDTSAESTHVASLPVESDSLLQILPDNPGPVEKPVNNVQQEGITNLVDQDNLNTPDPTSDNHDFAEAADSVDAVHTKALEDDLVTNLSLAPVDVTAPKKKNGKKEEEARARREKALARVKEAEEKRKAAEAIARHTREEREAKEKQLHEKKKKSIQKMPDTKSSNDNHSSTPARDARGSHEKISNVSTSKSATHPQLPPVPDEDTKIRERSTVVSLLTELDVENMKESDSLIEATPRRMLSSRSSRSSRSSSRDRRVSFDTTSDEVHGKMEPEILPEIRKSRDTTPRTRNRGVTPQSSRHVTPRASKHTTPRSSKHNTPRISKPNTANHSRSNTPKAGQINFFSDEDGIRSDSCDIDERLKSLEEASSEDLLSHKLYVIHEEKACKKIQNRIRIFLAIRRLNEKKSERKDLEVKSRSSIQIQRITRGRIGRKKVQAKILDVQVRVSSFLVLHSGVTPLILLFAEII